MAHTCYICGQK